MSLKVDPCLLSLLDQVRACLEPDEPLYLVGGGVRDLLLGRKLHDLDFVMPGDSVRLTKGVARHMNAGFFVLDDERLTARVTHINPDGNPFHLDFVRFTGSTLEEDLRNRDFTINAMAVPIREMSTIVDPLGGQKDLEDELIRVCKRTSLTDDPIRVLRAVRLAVELGLRMDATLENLMREAAAHLPETAVERQRDEFFKILEGPDPALGMTYFLRFDLFSKLIPPLVEQESIPASPPHVLPLMAHTLAALRTFDLLLKTLQYGTPPEENLAWWMQAAVAELLPFKDEIEGYFMGEVTPGRQKLSLALLATLLHDIGKPAMMKEGIDGRLHFQGHDRIGADLAWETAKQLQLSNAESAWVRKMVREHMLLLPLVTANEMPDRKSLYHFYKKAEDTGAAIAIHLLADTFATYDDALSESVWEKTLAVCKAVLSAWFHQRDTVIAPALLLNGNDLQNAYGLKPGKQIGDLLAALEEAQASGEVSTLDEAHVFIGERVSSDEAGKDRS